MSAVFLYNRIHVSKHADFATMAEAEILFSEPLEQLASYNGADMYKYNMLYIFIKEINQDVLTPESV